MIRTLVWSQFEGYTLGVIAAQACSFPAHNYEFIQIYVCWGLRLSGKWVNILRRAAVSHKLSSSEILV